MSGRAHREDRLTLSQKPILDSSKLKEFAGDNFEFDENGRKLSKRVENTVGKWRNCLLRAIFPFPSVFSKDLEKKFGEYDKEHSKKMVGEYGP